MSQRVLDSEVEALAHALRLPEACDLAAKRGDRFRALELALEARDHARCEQVAFALASSGDDANRARAMAVRRGDPVAEGILAEAYGALDEAVELYERGEGWGRAAKIHRARGDVARAGRALEHQVRIDPTDVEARLGLAEALADAGKFDAALRALGETEGERAATVRSRAHVGLGLAGDGRASSPAAQDAPHGLLFGRYQVVREVASTPSSRVLEAIDRLSADAPGRARVALKIFTGTMQIGAGRDALARFRREMEILSQLEVSSVLRPRAFLAEGPTIVLPWMAGGSVEGLLSSGPLAPHRAREIGARVLEALDAAHRRGVIHRDIKAANVLLDEAGGAFLADFGVAHLGDTSATATAGVFGTIRYMAPEQRIGEPATAQSDLYAVGVLLCEMLGVPPDPTRFPKQLGDEAAQLLEELLAESPSARPHDAASVRVRLLRVPLGDAPMPKLPSERPPESLRSTADRFELLEGESDVRRDGLLEREELLVREDDPRAPLVRALAKIRNPMLPVVIGYDGDRRGYRVEAVRGAPVKTLSADAMRALEDAMRALHREGVMHGDVLASIRSTLRGPVLALPRTLPRQGHTPEDDVRALRLRG